MSFYVHFILFLFFSFDYHLVSTAKSLKESSLTDSKTQKSSIKNDESEFISEKFKATNEKDITEAQQNVATLMTESKNIKKTEEQTPAGKEVT
jgi:hypothetical protein